jgi:hypothetical protein
MLQKNKCSGEKVDRILYPETHITTNLYALGMQNVCEDINLNISHKTNDN